MTDELLPWVDIETTGLSPERDYMLEIALVVTDLDFYEVLTKTFVINVRPDVALPLMDDYVRNMHTNNGLLDDITGGKGRPIAEVDALLAGDMLSTFGTEYKPPMCGSSVHFDRSFIAKCLPSFHKYFSYRNIDVSTIKETAKRFGTIAYDSRPGQDESSKKHRALDDVRASIAEYEHYLFNFTRVGDIV